VYAKFNEASWLSATPKSVTNASMLESDDSPVAKSWAHYREEEKYSGSMMYAPTGCQKIGCYVQSNSKTTSAAAGFENF
jgi:hypothetical protein